MRKCTITHEGGGLLYGSEKETPNHFGYNVYIPSPVLSIQVICQRLHFVFQEKSMQIREQLLDQLTEKLDRILASQYYAPLAYVRLALAGLLMEELARFSDQSKPLSL